MTTSTKDLSKSAMLVTLKQGRWRATKKDERLTRELQARLNSDMARVNKDLLENEGLLKKISQEQTAARSYHDSVTVPWSDDGTRVLRARHYTEYLKRMNEFKSNFNKLVVEFVSNFESLRDSAAQRLGDAYNPADYPTLSELRAKFKMDWEVSPMPTSGHLMLDLPRQQQDALREQVEASTAAKIASGMKTVHERLAKALSHMTEKLAGFNPNAKGEARGTFRDSLVENVSELCELMPALNITDDPELTKLAAQVKSELTKHTANELREDEDKRHDVAEKAGEMLNKLSGIM